MMSITRSRAKQVLAALALCLSAAPALAETLALPSNAKRTSLSTQSAATYAVPVAPFASGTLPVFEVSGRLSRESYRISQQGLTPQQILAPLEASLVDSGFDILFKCEDRFCGGFDFRFATDVIPAPDMFVDLFNYGFLSARRGQDYVTLLASRDSTSGYLQIIQMTPEGDTPLSTERSGEAVVTDTPTPRLDPPSGGIGAQLETKGRAILTDLAFKTGSSDLGDGPFKSLEALAAYLKERPGRRIALVGHTDAVGSLSGNIALSKRRATSVMKRLSSQLGVPASQLSAEGMGYLAPLTTNLTERGRDANRRVEAILLNTE